MRHEAKPASGPLARGATTAVASDHPGPEPRAIGSAHGWRGSDSSLAAFTVVGEESPSGYFLLTLTFWLAVPVSPAVSLTVTVTLKLPVFV